MVGRGPSALRACDAEGGHRLVHAVGVLAPRVVAVQDAIRAISEPPIQLDRAEVPRADLEANRRYASVAADCVHGLHHLRPESAAACAWRNRDGEDPTHLALEEQHGRRGHTVRAVVNQSERTVMAQNPFDVVSTEAVLLEAEDFESVQRL